MVRRKQRSPKSTIKIAMDGRTIVQGKSGVGTYVERTVRALLKIDKQNQYYLFLVEPMDDLEAPNLTKVLMPGIQEAGKNRYWENFLLPPFLDQHKVDIFFGAAYALPVLPQLEAIVQPLPLPSKWKAPFTTRRRVKYVACVLDVIGFMRPETFTPKMRLWQHIFVSNAMKVADAVITISESTKRDLLNLYSYDPSKIYVTPLSVDKEFGPKHPPSDVRRVRNRYTLPEKFVLYVGTIEPRKNVAGIARAYSSLPPKLRAAYPLVIAGSQGWYAQSILEEIRGLGISESIRLLGFVHQEDLPTLMSLASLFVFPSLYEGFGYPALEAMASGVPVISSTSSSLPEVVGSSGILVDPTDYSRMSCEMQRVLTDTRLHARLKTAGMQRAKKFSWVRTAEQTLTVLTRTVR